MKPNLYIYDWILGNVEGKNYFERKNKNDIKE